MEQKALIPDITLTTVDTILVPLSIKQGLIHTLLLSYYRHIVIVYCLEEGLHTC